MPHAILKLAVSRRHRCFLCSVLFPPPPPAFWRNSCRQVALPSPKARGVGGIPRYLFPQSHFENGIGEYFFLFLCFFIQSKPVLLSLPVWGRRNSIAFSHIEKYKKFRDLYRPLQIEIYLSLLSCLAVEPTSIDLRLIIRAFSGSYPCTRIANNWLYCMKSHHHPCQCDQISWFCA